MPRSGWRPCCPGSAAGDIEHLRLGTDFENPEPSGQHWEGFLRLPESGLRLPPPRYCPSRLAVPDRQDNRHNELRLIRVAENLHVLRPTITGHNHELDPEGAPSLSQTPGARSVATLSRDLADFLVEFSIVLHKRAMYPLGHPHLQESTARFVNRLESLLAPRDIAGDRRRAPPAHRRRRGDRPAQRPPQRPRPAASPAPHRHAALRARHLACRRSTTCWRALAADPQGDAGPFGLRPGVGRRVGPPQGPAARAQPPVPAGGGEPTTTRPRRRAGRSGSGSPIWRCRRTAARPTRGGSAGRRPRDRCAAGAGRRTIASCSTISARSPTRCPGARGPGSPAFASGSRDWSPRSSPRRSGACSRPGPTTPSGAGSRSPPSEVLAVDAVIEVVEAAAATTGQTISHQLLRLLHKFAHHAEQGPERGRAEAESMLRRNVAQLITEWNLEDPNPGDYTAVLDGMVRQSPRRRGPDGGGPARLRAGAGAADRARDRLRGPAGLRGARHARRSAAGSPRRSACFATRRRPAPPRRTRCGATSPRPRGSGSSSPRRDSTSPRSRAW